MKRGTPRHRKMRDLARRLNIPLAHAVGIMEMIWHWAGQETPQGDIGLAEDREIAAAADWAGRPSVLVDALVDSRWLDRDDVYRLVIHDWPDHADNSVKKWLDRNGKDFLPVYSNGNGQCPEIFPDTVQKKNDPPAQARAGLAWLSDTPVESRNPEEEGVRGEVNGGGRRVWLETKFEEFWSVVWIKVGKNAAKRAFAKAANTQAVADQIIVACREQGRSIVEHATAFNHSVLHPSTWLNEGRYLDEPQLIPEPTAPKSKFQILAENTAAKIREMEAQGGQ